MLLRMRRLVRATSLWGVVVVGLLVFTSGAASATASSVRYDPSLGTLPDSQGWTFTSHLPGPAPQVSAGLLHLGPTGDTAAWVNSDLVFDLTSPGTVLVVEATLQVVSSIFTLGFGGTTPRAGYEITMGDTNGRGFTLFLSDDQLDLMNKGMGAASDSAAFDTTDGLHTYRVIASAGNAQVFADGNATPLLSASMGDPGWFDPYVAFGDGTSAASSETYMAGISFSVIPEPSTALLLGIGLAGLGMRRRLLTRRRC